MNDEWARLSFMRFKPAQVEAITGFSPDLQRKWIERYFDFPDRYWHTGGERAHRRFTWSGVQMIAVFGDVLTDLGKAEIARAALLQEGPDNIVRSTDTFQFDLRDRENGDLFAIRWFDRAGAAYFTTTNLGSIKTLFGDHWGNRAYLYSISAMQRRLVDNALPMLEAAEATA